MDIHKPFEDYSKEDRKWLIEGTRDDPEEAYNRGEWYGVRGFFKWQESRSYKMHVRVLLSRYRAYTLCSECQGARLSPAALAYKVAGLDLSQWHAQSVAAALDRVDGLGPRSVKGRLCQDALGSRLRYLEQVGLGYLTLDRQARTLSGGEAQRAGLTTALGAALTGTLFILDEPSVGLHACDVPRLGAAMQALSRAGNTVLLVEHDESLVQKCDRVLELGPGAGKSGGQVLFDGSPQDLIGRPDLPTGRAWQRRRDEALLRTPRRAKQALAVRGVRTNNLQDLDVEVPLGVLVAVTGPSGSGKSTLVEDVLYRAVARLTGDTTVERPAEFAELRGAEHLRRAVLVDQSPLGRTARGNPATYTKAWDRLRARLAAEPEAAKRGLLPSSFSFNVAAGRCEACDGEGYETVEMQFLADVSFLCPVCQGKRFQPEVLEVRYRGRSVAELLEMTVDQVLAGLDTEDAPDPALRRALGVVQRLGLGYLPLGLLVFGARVRAGQAPGASVVTAVAIGAALSFTMELLQNYLPNRVASNVDLALNVAGTACGAALGLAVHLLGGVARWQAVRERWFIGGSAGGLALLLLWPFGLLFPAPVPLGLGQVWLRLQDTLSSELDGSVLLDWAGPWLHALPPHDRLSAGQELATVALGLMAPCMIALTITAPGWRRFVMLAGAVTLGAAATTRPSTAARTRPSPRAP